MKKIAVILSGCGYLDGSEIRESVLTLLALELAGAQYEVFAPDIDQHHVVNHMTGQEQTGMARSVLEESARIARGNIKELGFLNTSEFDALIMPGGFGLAKNLSTFAFDGSGASINELVISKIIDFNDSGKPIGAICIAPAILALAIGNKKPAMTVGNDDGVASELVKLGVQHQACQTSACIIDQKNKIVSTPAYMDNQAKLPDIYKGITRLVSDIISMA
ncbi:isoprenoid biosynthesis glyoxalase ElbB [Microbulbifer sp. SSSA002]|uniref:isoprenoid biosynthesis glyoxalase ElbB n=1 Tax=Microbulbifer sp. SSSA002 TaxID=3243376 RepID=UPI0040390F24